MGTGSVSGFTDVVLSGGELLLAVARICDGNLGKSPDLARLNLLLFLIEGDGGLRSDLSFQDTVYGPKSPYVQEFLKNNPDLIKTRASRRKLSASADPDLKRNVVLTAEAGNIAERAIGSLPKRELKIVGNIIARWGTEKYGNLLTYVCLFYDDFCTKVERREDPKSLS